MHITNCAIRHTLLLYFDRYPTDKQRCQPLLELSRLENHLSMRSTFPAHVTVSGLVIYPHDGKREALLIHHNSLQRWLCPGGHLEAGDSDLFGSCLREIEEETGISPGSLRLPPSPPIPLDVDGHTIPSNPQKNEPEHTHWDFRFLLAAQTRDVAAQLCEVSECRWLALTEIEQQATAARNERMLRCLGRLGHRTPNEEGEVTL